jgi:tetratricopeptide (TPR) repeat protein
MIVGRDRELQQMVGALDDVAHGRGSIWFLTGEPGIGKSRLAEEIGSQARQRQMRVFWGRCWEAGGAPAYWPWVQVLRALLRTADPHAAGPHADALAQILPELRQLQPTETLDLEPDQARFQLMDAIGSLLGEAARPSPLVIVLEDLHAADVSSVLLLEFLSGTVRHQALLVLGTFREAQLADAPAGSQLLRVAQEGHRISLRPFSEDEVASFLNATGRPAQRDVVATLHRTTDGHPLFLTEVVRLWRAQGSSGSPHHLSIPASVRTAISERLAGLTPTCARTLQRGAVVGREFDIALLETAYEDDPVDHVAGCREALQCSVLAEVGPQRYRFLHFLIRQQVYETIGENERADAHARLARALQMRHPSEEPRWPEVAHHLVAAGNTQQAAVAYRNAGAQALRQLAFEEAVLAYRSALQTARSAGKLDSHHHAELLLDLAHAQTRAGQLGAGKETSLAAANLARAIGSADLFAKAALEHGSALILAKVDSQLVTLLEQALDGLDPADGLLRARVMARLAAALQPATDPEGPIQLARDAIAMARRLGDRETLLDALRNGGSAMVDLGDLEERLALDREHAALAEQLGNPVEALRGNLRSVMDYLELGRLDDAFRAMRACERITARLDHPAYRWRSTALQALRATWEGNLEEAEELVEQVRLLGERGSDPNAGIVHAMQKVRLLQFRGDFDAQIPLLAKVESHWDDSELGRSTAKIIVGAEHVLAGRTNLALRDFDKDAAYEVLRMGDRTMDLNVARLAVAAEDSELAERVHHRLLLARDRFVTGGVLHMTLEGPSRWGLASVARFLERHDEAREHYEHALHTTRRTGGRPVHALIAFEYAQLLATSDAPLDRRRALDLARHCAAGAQELGMRALEAESKELVTQLEGSTQEPSSSADEADRLTMHPMGDAWLVRYGNVEFHLKNVRGARLLAALVAEPGREFHVLDLSRDGKVSTPAVDRSTNGEVLDEEARRQYKTRISELQEELAEAEAYNDTARIEPARRELAFIEKELSRALGLGARPRRSGSAAERARVNVQRRLRDAIRRVEAHHPGLAKHLDRSVRTGMYCVYDP